MCVAPSPSGRRAPGRLTCRPALGRRVPAEPVDERSRYPSAAQSRAWRPSSSPSLTADSAISGSKYSFSPLIQSEIESHVVPFHWMSLSWPPPAWSSQVMLIGEMIPSKTQLAQLLRSEIHVLQSPAGLLTGYGTVAEAALRDAHAFGQEQPEGEALVVEHLAGVVPVARAEPLVVDVGLEVFEDAVVAARGTEGRPQVADRRLAGGDDIRLGPRSTSFRSDGRAGIPSRPPP